MNEMSTSFANTILKWAGWLHIVFSGMFFSPPVILHIHQINICSQPLWSEPTCQFCCDYHLFDLESLCLFLLKTKIAAQCTMRAEEVEELGKPLVHKYALKATIRWTKTSTAHKCTQSFRIVNVIIISPKERYESFSMISHANKQRLENEDESWESNAMESRKKKFNDGNTFHFRCLRLH